MRWSLALLVMIGLVGIYLLGRGITGMVISESCCFGPACSSEYLCDAAEPHLEAPARVHGLDILLGSLLLLALLTLFMHLSTGHRRKV